MSWILRAIRKIFNATFNNATPHVQFTTSTIQNELDRQLRALASPVPFQNFFNELRLKAMQQCGKERMGIREVSMLRKHAMQLWSKLTEINKQKYIQLARNSATTRSPLRRLREQKSSPCANASHRKWVSIKPKKSYRSDCAAGMSRMRLPHRKNKKTALLPAERFISTAQATSLSSLELPKTSARKVRRKRKRSASVPRRKSLLPAKSSPPEPEQMELDESEMQHATLNEEQNVESRPKQSGVERIESELEQPHSELFNPGFNQPHSEQFNSGFNQPHSEQFNTDFDQLPKCSPTKRRRREN